MGQWHAADEYDGQVREITFRSICTSPMCPPDTAMTEWQHVVLSPDKKKLVRHLILSSFKFHIQANSNLLFLTIFYVSCFSHLNDQNSSLVVKLLLFFWSCWLFIICLFCVCSLLRCLKQCNRHMMSHLGLTLRYAQFRDLTGENIAYNV